MKCKTILPLLLLLSVLTAASAQDIRIGTFNVRYDNPRDTGNLWVDRAPVVANLIRFHDFDIFGTQEGLKNQLDDISNALPQYTRYGKGRDDGKEKGEHSAIYYKKDRFTLLNKGDFWLSQTPDQPSLGWDATSYIYHPDKIEFSETDEQKQSARYYTLDKITGNKTRLTIDHYLKKNPVSELLFRFFRKDKLKNTLTQSMENLGNVVKTIHLPANTS